MEWKVSLEYGFLHSYWQRSPLVAVRPRKKDKQSFLPEGPERERFFVSGWMPQAEIMDLKEPLGRRTKNI